MFKACIKMGQILFMAAGIFSFVNCSQSFRWEDPSNGLADSAKKEGARAGLTGSGVPRTNALNTRLEKNFTDEVYAGYQGWFSYEGDGDIDTWFHWAGNKDGRLHPAFDLLPDTSIYPSSALVPAPFMGNYPLFSSKNEVVIETHFRLIAKTHIDGFAVQRFVGELGQSEEENAILRHRNKVLRAIKVNAERYEKKFYVMYDISGGGDDWAEKIKRDFTETIIDEMDLLGSPNYSKQSGRVVVCLWGIGFTDRPGTPQETIDLIRWFQDSHNAFVIGGVPTHWRTQSKDSKKDFLQAYLSADSIQPWLVGRFKNEGEARDFYEDVVGPDLEEIRRAGKHYQTVLWPGTSWYNLMKIYGNSAPVNEIPRYGGKFFWAQARLAAEKGLRSYIAMFDEYDEGTAIAPAATSKAQIPTGHNFLTLDADGIQMSSDFYLRLSSEIAEMLKIRSRKTNFTTDYMSPTLLPMENNFSEQRWSTFQFHRFISSNSHKCMDIFDASGSNGAPIHQWACHNGDSQRWALAETVYTGEFLLVSKNSRKCIEVIDANNSNGARIHQWDCAWESPYQRWKMESTALGIQLRSVGSDKCLDIVDAHFSDGALAQQWDCHGGANQSWQID